MAWKAQVSAVLRGNDLLRYVEGEVSLKDSLMYERHDQLILGWLLSAMLPTILPQVANLTTSVEVWSTLSTTYASLIPIDEEGDGDDARVY